MNVFRKKYIKYWTFLKQGLYAEKINFPGDIGLSGEFKSHINISEDCAPEAIRFVWKELLSIVFTAPVCRAHT